MRFSVLRVQSYRFSGQRGPDEAGGWKAIKQGTSSGHQARRRDDQGNFPGMGMCYEPKKGQKGSCRVRRNHLTKGPLPGVNTLRILADLWAKPRVSRSGYKFEYFSHCKM